MSIHTKNKVKGWSKQQPNARQRTAMLHKCGRKCFLGPNKSFPICTKNTCKRNKKGIQSAYMRARQYSSMKGTRKYAKIAKIAKRLLL
jgi:hypothetical protein